MKKYLIAAVLVGISLIPLSLATAQVVSISNVVASGNPTTWVQATSKPVTWTTTGSVPKVDVLVCYLRTGASDACFYAHNNITNTGSVANVRVGTNVPLNSTAYVKVRKAGTDSISAKSSQFKVVASLSSTLEVSSSTNTPTEGIVIVDDQQDTDDVEILRFKLKANGATDLTLNTLPLTFTSTGAGVGEIINTARLMIDGDIIGSETVSLSAVSSQTVIFDGLDFDIEAGDVIDVVVEVDVNDIEVGFTNGDTLRADVTAINRAAINVVNENGVQLTAAQKIGNAIGQVQTFQSEGIMVEFKSASESISDTNGDMPGGEQGTYEIVFNITAFEDDIYLPTGATSATSSIDIDDAVAYAIENSSGQQIALNSGFASTSVAVSTSADISGNYYIIQEGETETFSLRVVFAPGRDGFYRLQLHGLNYNVGSAVAADTQQLAIPASTFETDYLDINGGLSLGSNNQLASVIASLEVLLASLKESLQGNR